MIFFIVESRYKNIILSQDVNMRTNRNKLNNTDKCMKTSAYSFNRILVEFSLINWI